MTEREFKRVFNMAKNREYPQTEEFFKQAAIAISGCAYEKKICTKAQAAYQLNYHALMFNGEYDAAELENVHGYYKKNITLID